MADAESGTALDESPVSPEDVAGDEITRGWRPRVELLTRSSWIALTLVMSGVVLVWAIPVVGFPVALVVGVTLTPYGSRVQDRFAVYSVLVVAAVALVVTLGGANVTELTAKAILSGLLLIVGGMSLSNRGKQALPRVDGVTVVVGLALFSTFWAIYWPYFGATDAQVLSGLIGGWDHSSHFAILAGIHQQETVNFVAHDGTPAFFGGYPSLYAQIWALAIDGIVGGADSVPRSDLVVHYTVAAAATIAVSGAILVAVAGDTARRLAPRGSQSSAALAAAIAAWVAVLLGTTTWIFNVGHMNFLLALGVVAAGAWYAGRSNKVMRTWGAPLLVLAGVCGVLLYPPLVTGLAVTGAVVAWQFLPHRPIWWAAVALLGVVSAIALLLLAGIAPGEFLGSLQRMVRSTGGYAPLNAGLVLLAPAVLAGLVAATWTRPRRRILVAASLLLGLLAAAGAFVIVSFAGGVRITASYYTMKLLGAVGIAGLVVTSVLIALWFAAGLAQTRAARGDQRAVARAGAWLGFFAITVGAMAGYAGPQSAYLPKGSTVASGLAAYREREWLVQEVPEGRLILSASQALDANDAMPLMWDGGDLKNNVWLSSLQWDMTASEHAILSSLPIPFGEPAAAKLNAWLSQVPDQRVQIAYFRPETEALLRSIEDANPGQVEVRKMGT